MSELKEIGIKWEENGELHFSHVYLKSEADKVIADLEESNKNEVEQLLMEIVELKAQKAQTEDDCAYWKTMSRKCADDNEVMAKQRAEAFKRERHHKYKRCLGMAQEWRNYAAFCGMQSSCHNHRGFGKTAEKYSWKENHAWKCVHRYKELAEKFKETK